MVHRSASVNATSLHGSLLVVGLEYHCVKPANCQMITCSVQDILGLSSVPLHIQREIVCNTAPFVGGARYYKQPAPFPYYVPAGLLSVQCDGAFTIF